MMEDPKKDIETVRRWALSLDLLALWEQAEKDSITKYRLPKLSELNIFSESETKRANQTQKVLSGRAGHITVFKLPEPLPLQPPRLKALKSRVVSLFEEMQKEAIAQTRFSRKPELEWETILQKTLETIDSEVLGLLVVGLKNSKDLEPKAQTLAAVQFIQWAAEQIEAASQAAPAEPDKAAAAPAPSFRWTGSNAGLYLLFVELKSVGFTDMEDLEFAAFAKEHIKTPQGIKGKKETVADSISRIRGNRKNGTQNTLPKGGKLLVGIVAGLKKEESPTDS